MNKLLLTPFTALALAILTVGPGLSQVWAQEKDGAPQGPPPATVRVGDAVNMELQNHFSVVGRLVELRRASVAVETDGRVVELNAEEGDQVIAGQTILARIDDTWAKIGLQDAQAQMAQAQASIQAAKADLEQSQRDLSYLESLNKADSAKPKEVDDKRTQVANHQAMLAAAYANLNVSQAVLSRAQTTIERLAVRAPFDGIVVAKLTEVGQWVDQGNQIATIISRGQVDAIVDVPEDIISLLSIGQEIEVNIQAVGMELQGKIAAIIPTAATGARTFPVKIRLDDQQGKLKPGMSVTANLPLNKKSMVLTVPRDAVQTNVQGSRVWVAVNMPNSPMPAAIPVTVRVLFGKESRYAVSPYSPESPLQPGAKVVVEGAEALFPTQPLVFLPPDAPAKAAPVQPPAK